MSKIIGYSEFSKLKFSADGNDFLIFQGIPSHTDNDGLLCLTESLVYSVKASDHNTLAVGINAQMNKLTTSPAEIKIYTPATAAAIKYNIIYNILFEQTAQNPNMHGVNILELINGLADGTEKERNEFIELYLQDNPETGRSDEIKKIYESIQARANYSIEYLPQAESDSGLAREIDFYPTMATLLTARLGTIDDVRIPQIVVLKDDAEVKKFIVTAGDGLLLKKHVKSGFNEYMLKEIKAHVKQHAEIYPQAVKKIKAHRKSAARSK